MRCLSIGALGALESRCGATFDTVKSRHSWYNSRPGILTICLLFGALWMWFNLGTDDVFIPADSFAYLDDEGLQDIRNTTLGFEKILVLNLPFRTDRRDAMSLSAAVSNIKLEFVDGVKGDSIHQKAYPPPDENIKLPPGIRGSWRTHMNALQRVVEQNLTTALILEDDVDWDIRIRQNLQRFARASRFLTSPHNPLPPNLQSQTIRTSNTETNESSLPILSPSTLAPTLLSLALSSTHPLPYQPASPYGDPTTFDILWLGHCGTGMPRSPSHPLVLTQLNDSTVPHPHHLKAHPFQHIPDPLATTHPPHTRIYHHATGGTLCTIAYAVTQRGARRLLLQFGIAGWSAIFDAELGRWCAGLDPDMGDTRQRTREKQKEKENENKNGNSNGDTNGKASVSSQRKDRLCITTQPPLFAHHHPLNGESDIGGLGGGYARTFETKYLRLGVRMNLEALVEGGREVVDQWPDGEGVGEEG